MNGLLELRSWASDVRAKPVELIIGLSVFFAAAGGGAIRHAASGAIVVLFLVSLSQIKHWKSYWQQTSTIERFMLSAFALYFFSAVLSYYNVDDAREYVKHLDRYFRFLLLIPIYLLLSRSDLKMFRYLLAGALVSGPVYLVITLDSLAARPDAPAHGGYHWITFGDMAMLGAVFLMTVLIFRKEARLMKSLMLVSIACLIFSSVMSQARGAWIALPACLVVLVPVAIMSGRLKMRILVSLLLIAILVVLSTPAKDVIESRVQQAADEIELFQKGENYFSSVGSRLAMWDVAIDVWKKYPLLGTGPGDYDLEFKASQERGMYTRNHVHSSTHSIYFQALATTGSLGFIVLLTALFIAPFSYFFKKNMNQPDYKSVGGMVALTAFAVFGLTEAWILRSPLVSMYLVYFVVLATAVAKNEN